MGRIRIPYMLNNMLSTDILIILNNIDEELKIDSRQMDDFYRDFMLKFLRRTRFIINFLNNEYNAQLEIIDTRKDGTLEARMKVNKMIDFINSLE